MSSAGFESHFPSAGITTSDRTFELAFPIELKNSRRAILTRRRLVSTACVAMNRTMASRVLVERPCLAKSDFDFDFERLFFKTLSIPDGSMASSPKLVSNIAQNAVASGLDSEYRCSGACEYRDVEPHVFDFDQVDPDEVAIDETTLAADCLMEAD